MTGSQGFEPLDGFDTLDDGPDDDGLDKSDVDDEASMQDYTDLYGTITAEHELGDGLRLTQFDSGDVQLNADDDDGRIVFVDLTADDATVLADVLEEALDLPAGGVPARADDVHRVADVPGTGIVVGVDGLMNVRLFLPDDEDDTGDELVLTHDVAETWVDGLRALTGGRQPRPARTRH